jgi:hypothetical protein
MVNFRNTFRTHARLVVKEALHDVASSVSHPDVVTQERQSIRAVKVFVEDALVGSQRGFFKMSESIVKKGKKVCSSPHCIIESANICLERISCREEGRGTSINLHYYDACACITPQRPAEVQLPSRVVWHAMGRTGSCRLHSTHGHCCCPSLLTASYRFGRNSKLGHQGPIEKLPHSRRRSPARPAARFSRSGLIL